MYKGVSKKTHAIFMNLRISTTWSPLREIYRISLQDPLVELLRSLYKDLFQDLKRSLNICACREKWARCVCSLTPATRSDHVPNPKMTKVSQNARCRSQNSVPVHQRLRPPHITSGTSNFDPCQLTFSVTSSSRTVQPTTFVLQLRVAKKTGHAGTDPRSTQRLSQ